uniref:Lysophosphatidylcholine acyltransferase 1 n=1 Tax=Mus musculus TaxID=10090 RepID=D6RE48_MOUSE
MRLRGRGPRAAPSSSSGAGDARRLAPPGRNPFVHELRLSALQKAQGRGLPAQGHHAHHVVCWRLPPCSCEGAAGPAY